MTTTPTSGRDEAERISAQLRTRRHAPRNRCRSLYSLCEGQGGNDFLACRKCGLEWEYSRTYGPPRPACPNATPAQPVSAAGSEPVAWRGRNSETSVWTLYDDNKGNRNAGFDIVKPLYDTPVLAPQDEATGYAERLAIALAGKFYPDVPQWRPITGDLMGLLSQIDNITTGLVRRAPPEPDVLPGLKLALELHEGLSGPSGRTLYSCRNRPH